MRRLKKKKFIVIAVILLSYVTFMTVCDITGGISVPVPDIVISYIATVAIAFGIAFLWDLVPKMTYVAFWLDTMPLPIIRLGYKLSDKLKGDKFKAFFVLWLGSSIFGSLCFGLVLGTFGIVIGRFMLRIRFSLRDSIYLYKNALVGGLVFGNIAFIVMFIFLHILFYIQKKKKEHKKEEQ